jgi:broad specificity phosphatase PhoE
MTRIILVNNGQTDWSKDGRIQGELDIPLNKEGEKEAVKIALELSNIKIESIYSSALSRSYETATIIAKMHHLNVKPLKELNELNHGVWQGLSIDEIKKRYRKLYRMWDSAPGSVRLPQGETIKEAFERSTSVVQKLIQRHREQTVGIVTHRITCALIKSYYLKCELNKIWQLLPERAQWEIIEV